MNKQNVTLSLPKMLVKHAKALAVKEDKSLNAFIRETIEEKVRQKVGYREARERHLKILEKGFDLGTKGKIALSREELHERR